LAQGQKHPRLPPHLHSPPRPCHRPPRRRQEALRQRPRAPRAVAEAEAAAVPPRGGSGGGGGSSFVRRQTEADAGSAVLRRKAREAPDRDLQVRRVAQDLKGGKGGGMGRRQ
jgi:hypothetical protein